MVFVGKSLGFIESSYFVPTDRVEVGEVPAGKGFPIPVASSPVETPTSTGTIQLDLLGFPLEKYTCLVSGTTKFRRQPARGID